MTTEHQAFLNRLLLDHYNGKLTSEQMLQAAYDRGYGYGFADCDDDCKNTACR